MSQPRANAKIATEPEAVKVPAHVLRELSSADIAELVDLFNSGEPADQAKAFARADEDCRAWEARTATAVRCPICQRFTPCPKHPESAS